MKLDPTTYHRMRFEAALGYLNNTPEDAWSCADAFLAAEGYELEGGEPTPEPTSGDWSAAISESYDMPFAQDTDYYAHVSRRAHELARQRSQK